MRRLLILEGPDGAGKSTLAAELAKRGWRAHHHGSYPDDGDRLWERYLFSMLPAASDLADVVLDRAWQAEPIYGRVHRGGRNRLEPWQERMLERVALGVNALVVWCRPSLAHCSETFRNRKGKEMLADTAALASVYRLYAAIEGSYARLPSMTYDFERDGPPDEFAKLLDESTSTLNSGPGIGAWRPGEVTLLVGEAPGIDGGPRWHLPFVSLSRGGCSAWLADKLNVKWSSPRPAVHERELYWVNAYRDAEHRDETNPEFVERLRPRGVVALGDVAARWCDRYHLDFVAVPHPQYWKRFHQKAKRPYPLVKEIRRCLTSPKT